MRLDWSGSLAGIFQAAEGSWHSRILCTTQETAHQTFLELLEDLNLRERKERKREREREGERGRERERGDTR